jgi:hypothetical protein
MGDWRDREARELAVEGLEASKKGGGGGEEAVINRWDASARSTADYGRCLEVLRVIKSRGKGFDEADDYDAVLSTLSRMLVSADSTTTANQSFDNSSNDDQDADPCVCDDPECAPGGGGASSSWVAGFAKYFPIDPKTSSLIVGRASAMVGAIVEEDAKEDDPPNVIAVESSMANAPPVEAIARPSSSSSFGLACPQCHAISLAVKHHPVHGLICVPCSDEITEED